MWGSSAYATGADAKSEQLRVFVGTATSELASRLITLLDEIVDRTPEAQLMAVIHDQQWSDFRSFVAHLLRESNNLQRLQNQTEQLLRSTFGFSILRSQNDPKSRARADSLLAVTNAYAKRLSQNMGAVALADSTGFDPEGVRAAMTGLGGLENKLTRDDWEPKTLFGKGQGLSNLIGVMMQVPNLNKELESIAGSGQDRKRIADIAKAWVIGRTLQDIATSYFEGDDATTKITEACRGIYRAIVNNSVWGLSALSKLPGSGLDWDVLSEADRKKLNLLPAFLYHGVDTAEAVLLRMNQVPRSVAKSLGVRMRQGAGEGHTLSVNEAREFIRNLSPGDWQASRPKESTLSGSQYRDVWRLLSGESD